MPSTKMLNVRIRALPCFEQEGMVWIWPGDDTPTPTIPSLLPPSGFTIHAEVKKKSCDAAVVMLLVGVLYISVFDWTEYPSWSFNRL
jgi:phenylpropionate dioxygenase-like ring-hydroxylating dioxygenase large terminal subunit